MAIAIAHIIEGAIIIYICERVILRITCPNR